MSLSLIIEVAVALVLVYYILGLIVSFISARILETLETRGKDLEDYLKGIVGNTKLADLKGLPQIKSLAPIRYDGWLGVFTGKLKEVRPEQIPVSNLVDAVFDMLHLVDKEYSVDELKATIGRLPQSQVKENLQKFVEQGVTDINKIRAKTSMWFTGLMDQAAAQYKAHARQWVIFLSIAVTFLFGVDSIEFASTLWQNADLRAIADAKATFYAKQASSTVEFDKLTKDLGDLSLGLGWWSAPANMPQAGATWAWVLWVLLKIVGLGVTAAAVSQGSSFWYDTLRRLKGETAAQATGGTKNGEPAKEA